MPTKLLETRLGRIKGTTLSVREELTTRKCVRFGGIPFATCERFARPKPYGPWEDELDATGMKQIDEYKPARSYVLLGI